ncbi:MAG: prohibitin family protein, partial [Candidatus Magasanikiibacteriota bacterium]
YDFLLQTEKKEAERKVIEATGQRDSQQLINQSLTERYLQYLYINSLKDRQGTIYVPTNPNNGVPMFKGV